MPACDHRRLVAQAEVVVRREDQDVAAPFHLHARRLRRVEIVEPLVDLVGLELLDRACSSDAVNGWNSMVRVIERHGAHPCHAISKMTLPASPDLIARIASSDALEREAVRDHRRRIELAGAQGSASSCSHVSYMRRPTTP